MVNVVALERVFLQILLASSCNSRAQQIVTDHKNDDQKCVTLTEFLLEPLLWICLYMQEMQYVSEAIPVIGRGSL
jgi:hypothetical protein